MSSSRIHVSVLRKELTPFCLVRGVHAPYSLCLPRRFCGIREFVLSSLLSRLGTPRRLTNSKKILLGAFHQVRNVFPFHSGEGLCIMYLLCPDKDSDTHVPSCTSAKPAGLSFLVLLLVRSCCLYLISFSWASLGLLGKDGPLIRDGALASGMPMRCLTWRLVWGGLPSMPSGWRVFQRPRAVQTRVSRV